MVRSCVSGVQDTVLGINKGLAINWEAKMDLIYLAPLIFFCIAFVFSMLGMGGSQLYIPILFWLGMDFKRLGCSLMW
jgi:hypothetical protein